MTAKLVIDVVAYNIRRCYLASVEVIRSVKSTKCSLYEKGKICDVC